MEESRPSTTAQVAAAMRALHPLVDDDPVVFLDSLASTLIDSEGARILRGLWANILNTELTRVRGMCVMRHRFAEDELADAVARGVAQYVVLGAGLDSFGFRRPESMSTLRVFEVDHPGTQRWKAQRLGALGIPLPEHLAFVPVDFQTDSLFHELGAAGLAADQPTFCSWLGVTPYLTEDAALQTLTMVATNTAPGSRIAFDIALDPSVLGAQEREHLAILMARVQARGEPLLALFNPDDLVSRLRGAGYSQITYLTPQQITERFFPGRSDGLCAPGYYAMVSATVGG